MVNFGLEGKSLGIFLIAFNSIMFVAVLVCAWILRRRFLKEEARKEWMVSQHCFILSLSTVCLSIYFVFFFQAAQYEDARHFSEGKFKTTLDALRIHSIPPSNALVFHYTTFHLAKSARKTGIAAPKKYGGVPFTLRRPFTNTQADFKVFGDDDYKDDKSNKQKFPNESLLVLSVPMRCLEKLPGYEDDDCLCRISADILHAMRPTSFVSVVDETPWLYGTTLMPPTSILRSYYVMTENRNDEGRQSITKKRLSFLHEQDHVNEEIMSTFVTDCPFSALKSVSKLHSIHQYCTKMDKIRTFCQEHNLIPLYHYTDPKFAPLILRSGLRMSTQGQGDGGVYVSTQGPTSYALGTEQYEVNIIKDCFGVERLSEYMGKGKLDTVLIYGCSLAVLDQVM